MRNVNKVYEYIKKYIKENYLFLILLVLIVVFGLYDTGYSIYKPGGTINASVRVSGDNLYESKGSFNMAYVNMMKGRLPFYLLAKVIPSWELIKNESLTISSEEELSDVMLRDNLYYKEAISNALYIAYEKANIDYEVSNNNYYVIYKTENNDSDLSIGDEVLSYDNTKMDSVDNFIKYINSKKENDVIKIKYLHDKKEKETNSTVYLDNDKLYVGLAIVNILEYTSKYNIKVSSKGSESGPSGGFITALSIYNSLTKEDITKGKKIVGTGTIDKDGNIGEIGGVEYKLAAAVKDKADIFLCPKENYETALKYAKNKKYDIIIKEVSSFDDAIEYLNIMEG